MKPRHISEIQNAIANKNLVVVIGTGASQALSATHKTIFSWRGLIDNGISYCRSRSLINDGQHAVWQTLAQSDDLDDLISAAEFIGRKLEAPNGGMYSRWLEECFGDVGPSDNEFARILRNLKTLGIPIVTLNYDTLLEKVTGLPTIKFSDTRKVAQWARREIEGIVHLHGVWDSPESCVLGVRDYHSASSNEVRQFFQRHLSTFGRLLFIGCGDTFSDPNFSTLISWMRDEIKGGHPLHYAMVRESEARSRQADPTWQGFVEPISYGKEYEDLPASLQSILPSIEVFEHISKSQPPSTESQIRDDKTLTAYRSFLVKDCGQMTIEGIRTDIDTAQRKFDLEKLFVPLSVTPVPPEFPPSDKRREEKLKKWHEENEGPAQFGETFKTNERIALLALPGGGKTLLLKRLAVAYSNVDRRSSADDLLPNLELFPVLIRCREWREHISRPIPFILKNISAITGQDGLDNLYEALTPLLKGGKVVLLVDGLDEIHNDADRATFVENLEKFLEENKKVRLVVTSREAGFALIAPTIARFCSRWRIAPLDEEAISSLSVHWHKLMTGETPEALDEAEEVTERLISNPALRRLAENPLLLTMLLVVKHGAGRLPPDRVSLYNRAVEVLLDTWNIKGHEALNIKEALPQLSYIAYELMNRGKQTATQLELISLLEEAREKVPRIRMYAKDSPVDFLKRVELRSSLLMESGYQLEGAKAVPFYQFRHLTFQEYLAAEASVDGNYSNYSSDDSLLTPLAAHLEQQEWKEVVPMATVLARRQAESVILELVSRAAPHIAKLRRGPETDLKQVKGGRSMPHVVTLLLQCLAEETEASPAAMKEALLALGVFARGCRDNPNWDALLKGLYSDEFIKTIFDIDPQEWTPDIWLRNTRAVSLALTKSPTYWLSTDGQLEIRQKLAAGSEDEVERALLTIAGGYWGSLFHLPPDTELLELVTAHLLGDMPKALEPAAWVLGLLYSSHELEAPDVAVLDKLLELMLASPDENEVNSFAISKCASIGRDEWPVHLDAAEREVVLSRMDLLSGSRLELGCFVVAFHAKNVIDDRSLYGRLKAMDRFTISGPVVDIIKTLEKSLRIPKSKRIELPDRARRTRRIPPPSMT